MTHVLALVELTQEEHELFGMVGDYRNERQAALALAEQVEAQNKIAKAVMAAKIARIMNGKQSFAFRLAAQSAILAADTTPGKFW